MLTAASSAAPGRVRAALAEFDLRQAAGTVVTLVEAANRHIERVRPWELAKLERDGNTTAGARLDAALATLVRTCRAVAVTLDPFTPGLAAQVATQCTPIDGILPPATPLFPRLEAPSPKTRT